MPFSAKGYIKNISLFFLPFYPTFHSPIQKINYSTFFLIAKFLSNKYIDMVYSMHSKYQLQLFTNEGFATHSIFFLYYTIYIFIIFYCSK